MERYRKFLRWMGKRIGLDEDARRGLEVMALTMGTALSSPGVALLLRYHEQVPEHLKDVVGLLGVPGLLFSIAAATKISEWKKRRGVP